MQSSSDLDIRLRLAKMAAVNINSLVTEGDSVAMFRRVLRETVAEVSRYLKLGRRNSKKLFSLFSEFRVTWNPRISWQYDTNGNALVINLLSLLYQPAWVLAMALVHEGEHVLFLKRKGMLDAVESEQEAFADKHMRESETQATKQEQRFLLAIKGDVASTTITPLTARRHTLTDIDDHIERTIRTLRDLRDSEDNRATSYVRASERIAENNARKIALELNIELPAPDSEEKYKQVTIAIQGLCEDTGHGRLRAPRDHGHCTPAS